MKSNRDRGSRCPRALLGILWISRVVDFVGLVAALAIPVLAPSVDGAESASPNLALEATATASESFEDLTPGKAADGRRETRWSGVPGHATGVSFELRWPTPVLVGEVVVHQFDRYVRELDVEALPAEGGQWSRIEHIGRADSRLAKTIVSRFAPRKVLAIRFAQISGGPSFTEVEARECPFAGGLAVELASDLQGNFTGVVADSWGTAPVPGARVTLRGQGAAGDWSLEAEADAHGLFTVPMPFGLRGRVEVQASVDPGSPNEARGEAGFDAVGFQLGLTPPGARRDSASLDGAWRFATDPAEGFWMQEFDDASWKEIRVPAHWEMQGFRTSSGVGGYRRWFDAGALDGRSALFPGMQPYRIKLHFEAVQSGAEVWLNGRPIARHEGGATPFEADVTDDLREGRNLLALRVREHTPSSDLLDHMSLYAYFPLAGITRSVSIFRVPLVHVGSLRITTPLDAARNTARVLVRALVWNESPRAFRGRIEADVEPEKTPEPEHPVEHETSVEHERPVGSPEPGKLEKREMPMEPVELERSATTGKGGTGAARSEPFKLAPWARQAVDLEIEVREPETWDAEHPRLSRLRLRLADAESGRIQKEFTQVFGIRDVEVRGTEILINGHPVKLQGSCHHDSHPLDGRAVSPELAWQDVRLMREANLNAVRTSHYPPGPALLDAADRLGLWVEDEAPFCWVGVSNDIRIAPRIRQLTAELLERDFNHPSVVIWSLSNESEFGWGFERSHEFVRAADPSRPTSAATSADLEIATLHNPFAVSRMEATEGLSTPLLFDESFGIFQGIFGDVGELGLDPGIRDYYAEPLREVHARFLGSRVTQGSMIWCWSDDIFCVPGRGIEYGRNATRYHFLEASYRIPGRGIVGDAPWGVVDGWRRKKPEFWITKKLHSPIFISEEAIPCPPAGTPLHIEIENRYDFTDLAEVDIAWRIGEEAGILRGAVPPRSRGSIEIPASRFRPSGDTLSLEFRRGEDRIDAFRIPVGEPSPPVPPFAPTSSGFLTVGEENTLGGSSVRIAGADFEFAFDRGTGLLRRGVVHGRVVLFEAPVIHVLPAGRPFDPLPRRATWSLERFEVTSAPDGSKVRVVARGSHPRFRGEYTTEIDASGVFSARAEFVYSGEALKAREVGLRLSVPRDLDRLSWERRAPWNVYPTDHIRRPRGEAEAFPDRIGGSTASTESPTAPTESAIVSTERSAASIESPKASTESPTASIERAIASRPWALDPSPLGSNDFRSSKRHAVWAGLHDPEGFGILVEAEGKRHVRATVETDRISLHILETQEGTGAGLWEWIHNYGDGRPLRDGDRIEAGFTFRMGRFEGGR